MTIFSVRLDGIALEVAAAKVAAFLADGERGRYIVTPNPEMLVAARKDEKLRRVLNGAAISLVDGFGIRLVAWLLREKPLPKRVTGTDFLDELCRQAVLADASIYFCGAGRAGSAEKAAEVLKQRHPGLRVVGADRGGWKDLSGASPIDEAMMERIRQAAPDILVVPFGHGVQEKFMAERLGELPSVKLAIGVGGALDFWSGMVRRAPRWMRAIGFEWLWRLGLDPKRWRRILTAVVVFPWLAIREKVR